MARRDPGTSAVGVGWLHAGAVVGLLAAGGGLLLGVWGLIGQEQEAQRGMLSYLYLRAARGRPAEERDFDTQNLYYKYGGEVRIAWGWVLTGTVTFAAGSYLAGLSLVAMARRPRGPADLPATCPPPALTRRGSRWSSKPRAAQTPSQELPWGVTRWTGSRSIASGGGVGYHGSRVASPPLLSRPKHWTSPHWACQRFLLEARR